MNLRTAERRDYLNSPYVRFSLIVIAGLILRICLSMFFTYETDFNTWRGWGLRLEDAGFGNFYERHWCDYMPGYLYVLRLLENIHRTFQGLPVEILYKLPANLADVGITILIFFALRDITSNKNAMVASLIYLFNPASLSNSTFWGQIDSFHALPILFAVFLGLRRRFILSGVFAALAFMIKPQSIVVFPVIGLLSIMPFLDAEDRFSLRRLIHPAGFVAAVILVSIIVTLPFYWDKIDSLGYIVTGPFELIRGRFEVAYEQYKYTSLNAFNFWGSFAMWRSDETLFLGLSYKTWGTVIFGTLYALIAGLLCRFAFVTKERDGKAFGYLVFEAITLILFALFLFVTRAHERHLLPAIVFFTLIAFRAWILWYLYAIVSCVYVVNMVYSYIQLTTSYEAVPTAVTQILSVSMFLLYLIVFIAVLLDFIKNSVGYKNSMNPFLSRTQGHGT